MKKLAGGFEKLPANFYPKTFYFYIMTYLGKTLSGSLPIVNTIKMY
jgi:hypothetical protein